MEKVLVDIPQNCCTVYLDDLLYMGDTFYGRCLWPSDINSAKGISTDPSKISVVKDWPKLVNMSQLRTFLRLTSYYRRFVKDFATIASPFCWDCDQARAFTVLLPFLEYPDISKPVILNTDASNVGLGAV